MDDIYFYIDESLEKNSDRLMLCLVVVLDNENTEIKTSITELKDNISHDQFLGIRKKYIKNLFHFTDDNYEVRNRFIDRLRCSHFKGYIAYKKISESYQETYKYLFYKLLRDRIKKYPDNYIKILYEQNPNIQHHELKSQIDNTIRELQKNHETNNTYNIEVQKETKDNIRLGIPDYTLGVFSNYLYTSESNNSHLAFEKIRGKIRLIMDLDNHEYFTKNNII